MSVDLTIPDPAPLLDMGHGCIAKLVPLAHFTRQPLVGFDLLDESGQSISFLTATEAGRILAEGIIQLGRIKVHDDPKMMLPGGLEAHIRKILTGGNSEDARKLYEDNFGTKATGVGKDLADDAAFGSVFNRYRRLFLMIIPVQEDKRSRRILKYRYEKIVDRSGGPWKILFGKPACARIELPSVREAASYHLEIILPDGVRATDVDVEANPQGAEDENDKPNVERKVVGSKVHLCVHSIRSRATGTAIASLRVSRGGWLASATLAAWLIALVLAMGDFWTKTGR